MICIPRLSLPVLLAFSLLVVGCDSSQGSTSPGTDSESGVVGTWSYSARQYGDLLKSDFEMIFQPSGQFKFSERRPQNIVRWGEYRWWGTWRFIGKDSVEAVSTESAFYNNEGLYEGPNPSSRRDTIMFHRSGTKLITYGWYSNTSESQRTWDPEPMDR